MIQTGSVALPPYDQTSTGGRLEDQDHEEAVNIIINENHVPQSNAELDKTNEDMQDRPGKENRASQTEDSGNENSDSALLTQQ